MNLLLTADLHLTANPKEAYRHTFMSKHLIRIAKKEAPDRIIIAGDLTEQKDRHPAELVNATVDHIARLREIAPVIVLEVNHDYADSQHVFFSFLDHMESVTWISVPQKIGNVLYLPHTHTPKLDWAGASPSKVVIAHQLFDGATAHGTRIAGGIDQALLPKAKVTLAGDVHAPQKIGRVEYIGAPYTIDFGDDYKPRIVVLDDDFKLRSIDVSAYPQKRVVEVTTEADLKRLFKFNQKDMIRFRLYCDAGDKFERLRDAAVKQAEENDLIVWSIERVAVRKAVRRNHDVAATVTDEEAFEAFGKRHSVAKPVLKTGRTLL